MSPGLTNLFTGQTLATDLRIADTFLGRAVGLLGRSGLAEGEGLLLQETASIHTFFMRFALDVVFVGRDLDVVKVVRDLRPWRLAWGRGSWGTIELASGALRHGAVSEGDRLAIVDLAAGPAPTPVSGGASPRLQGGEPLV